MIDSLGIFLDPLRNLLRQKFLSQDRMAVSGIGVEKLEEFVGADFIVCVELKHSCQGRPGQGWEEIGMSELGQLFWRQLTLA